MKRLSSLLIAVLIALLIAVLITVLASSPVYAAQKTYLKDDAGLLSSSEKTAVESALQHLSQMYDMDAAVLTVYGLEGKSPEAYADDYYDNTYNKDGNIDGIILLVDMESRSWQVETGGRCIDAVNDDGIEYIEDSVVSFLSDGEYGQAFLAYADSVSYLMNLYDSGSAYVYREPVPWGRNIAVALVIGAIAGFAAAGAGKQKLKTVRRRTAAGEYEEEGSLCVTQSRDIFLYHTVTAVPLPRDDGPGGGTHMSAGGFSHGGGGGKF